jgi:hypothetical protein
MNLWLGRVTIRRSVMDDTASSDGLRNELKQSRQLQVMRAQAALVPAFLDVLEWNLALPGQHTLK